MSALAVQGLDVSYGGAGLAVQGVSLTVPQGGVVALLGNNGAGKTTVLRAISATLRLHRGAVRAGSITWDGADVTRRAPAAMVRSGVVTVPEGRHVFARLTVAENLRAGATTVRGRSARSAARDRVLDLFPALAPKLAEQAGLLSGGEQQMVAIGRALMGSPRLVLLDEPSLGLSPRMITTIAEAIASVGASGVGVLLVEQHSAMALGLAETAYVLDVGRVRLCGRVGSDVDLDRVRALYLGESVHETGGVGHG